MTNLSQFGTRVRLAMIIAAGWMLGTFGLGSSLLAQPPVHYLHQGTLPPGEIGTRQLELMRSRRNYFQPVEVTAPEGAKLVIAADGGFAPGDKNSVLAGMLIGPVYRLKVTNIPNHPGLEVYPTVEVIDRLCPPPGQAARFPIPIELTPEELQLAAEGRYVQRVIYLENPEDALPAQYAPPRQRYYEIAPHLDLMETADQLGRPMAILRMGSRVPDDAAQDGKFMYNTPPFQLYEGAPAELPRSAGLEKPLAAPNVQGQATRNFRRLSEEEIQRR